jgi:hypothetical protein
MGTRVRSAPVCCFQRMYFSFESQYIFKSENPAIVKITPSGKPAGSVIIPDGVFMASQDFRGLFHF